MSTKNQSFPVTILNRNSPCIFTQLLTSDIGDYEIDEMYFEIGGKKKKKNQIKNHPESSYIVKDDILYGEKRVIPLYLCGFLY